MEVPPTLDDNTLLHRYFHPFYILMKCTFYYFCCSLESSMKHTSATLYVRVHIPG